MKTELGEIVEDKRSGVTIGCGAPADARALRVNEFAKRYRVSRTKTYELIASGAIHSVVIAGRRVIPTSEGERILREGA